MNVLITGIAGFIGYSLAQRLLSEGFSVYGIDNLNDYYDVSLKKARLEKLQTFQNLTFQKIDVCEREKIRDLFCAIQFDYVFHLAAQAGVRYSIENPFAYGDSNLSGFLNILEACRNAPPRHFIFASSSSVYGANRKVPFSISDSVDHPVSLYAATKKANELMAHAYSHLYEIPTTGLRFFTVYGPWGRPDMAYFKFVDAIAHDRPIEVYNYGKMRRDFTYVDDVVEGIVRIARHPPECVESTTNTSSKARFKVYNIGNNNPVELLEFINAIESAMGEKANMIMKPMQPGDVVETYADIEELKEKIAFSPSTSIEDGISRFVEWYTKYYVRL
ncbi:NAD-dependent epimerase [cf. Phormidesmis sp. LEGE 11477]|uniref:NAD-dependent epimerase n=1 Tax=cf. Phormidesmis sp. LEGE 11477 TaxID=1828680 RepID=UPI00187E46B5|nr:NAD-dependent epimerase [cf. Phormidesmis sp. LEGE 11477]MBE9061265.1 NAD-dependent epimerase [cf. Phormidesmis sp. LEGE 11477]